MSHGFNDAINNKMILVEYGKIYNIKQLNK